MQIIAEKELFSPFYFSPTYTWIILFWHQLPAPLRGFQQPNNKQIRGQRRACIPQVPLCVQLWGCVAVQAEASWAAAPTPDAQNRLRCEGLGGTENTNFAAHQKRIMFPVLFLLVSSSKLESASSPNSSWGQVEQALSDIVSQCEHKKNSTAQGQIASKLIILQSRCESATTVNVNLHKAWWERNFNNDIMEGEGRGQQLHREVPGPFRSLKPARIYQDNVSPCLVIAVLGYSD